MPRSTICARQFTPWAVVSPLPLERSTDAPSALRSSPVSGISYTHFAIQYISQVGFFLIRKLILSRYIFNSFPFIALPRQKRNASEKHFLPQQNSCGNLKYCDQVKLQPGVFPSVLNQTTTPSFMALIPQRNAR